MHYIKTGQSDSDGESGGGVRPLQRASSPHRAGVSFTTGIYTHEVISALREKTRLDI